MQGPEIRRPLRSPRRSVKSGPEFTGIRSPEIASEIASDNHKPVDDISGSRETASDNRGRVKYTSARLCPEDFRALLEAAYCRGFSDIEVEEMWKKSRSRHTHMIHLRGLAMPTTNLEMELENNIKMYRRMSTLPDEFLFERRPS